ncbi:MAG: GSCFA domain-containing protein [Fermentimonas sp.]|nr:GSCFA domain-containing protein [Fermentimonas sp.]
MDFRTHVQIPNSGFKIDHSSKMMLFGSCFSENIGRKLQHNKFDVDVNPFGILYNPMSVSSSLKRLLQKTEFTESDLVYNNEMYHSFMHHGSFSDTDKDVCLKNISERYEKATDFIDNADIFLITFGSAYVFRLKPTVDKENSEVVSNCHKFPADIFERTRLSVEEIVEEWRKLIISLKARNPHVRFVFTVSPIRHWKDGAHENQISKSILHLAIEQLTSSFGEDLQYFPAYEIMIDELRDYRFYEEDMNHPTSFAVDYIWKLFSKTFFSDATILLNKEWAQIRKSINHKPLFPTTNSYRSFLNKTLSSLNDFASKYPFISCEREIHQISSLLKSHERD